MNSGHSMTPTRRTRTIVNGLSILLAACAVNLPAMALAERPNVIILFTDDQGTLDADCYGSTDLHTPHIDKLAATGVRFTQAYAHTVCCPARAMLVTGRYPQRSDVNSWTQGQIHGPKGRNMMLREVTLAEALKSAGYTTALFGKWHLGAHPDHGPTKQGFDEFFGNRTGFIDNYNHYFLHGSGFHDLYDGTTEVRRKGEFFPKMITDRAVKFIEKNKDGPFFDRAFLCGCGGVAGARVESVESGEVEPGVERDADDEEERGCHSTSQMPAGTESAIAS